MRIVEIATQNFRAFPAASLQLRPLTVIVGANGLGKSSLFQPLLILRQTFERLDQPTPHDLVINGPHVSYGPPVALCHKGNAADSVRLHVTLEHPNLVGALDRTLRAAENSGRRAGRAIFRELEWLTSRSNKRARRNPLPESLQDFITDVRPRLSSLFNQSVNAIQLAKLLDRVHEMAQGAGVAGEDNWVEERPTGFRTRNLPPISADLRALSGLRATLQDITTDEISVDFEFSPPSDHEHNLIRLHSLALAVRGLTLVKVYNGSEDDLKLASDVLEPSQMDELSLTSIERSDLSLLRQMLSFEADAGDPGVAKFLLGGLCEALQALDHKLSSLGLVHVGPFRTFPSRYYDQSNREVNNERALRLAATLLDGGTSKKHISDWWAKRTHIRFSGEDIEGSLASVRVAPHWLDSSTKLTLADTGHGYSQVLPVMSEILAAEAGAIVMVEQPEAHLHPDLHPELADWIMERSQSNETNSIIVETHSEYILRRIMRRVVEGVIAPEDISILYVEQADGAKNPQVRRVTIDSDSGFTWPSGFYEQTLQDNIAISNAMRSRK